MTIHGDYLGMTLRIDALDQENLAYFRHCAAHDYRLQRCAACALLRYPPTTGCPWCGHPEAVWTPVEWRGTVHTYAEVHHAIEPAFKDHLPYLILIVELDAQQGRPGAEDGLRIAGNLAAPDGGLAAPELVAQAGIGTRCGWCSRTSRPASPSRSGPSTRRWRPPARSGAIRAACRLDFAGVKRHVLHLWVT
jgi:uncharacterized protein